VRPYGKWTWASLIFFESYGQAFEETTGRPF
jgi:hypothetical protein